MAISLSSFLMWVSVLSHELETSSSPHPPIRKDAMRNGISTIGKVSLFLFVLAVSAAAENRLITGAPPAASGPDYDVSVGYTYLAMPVPSAGNVNLNGVDASAHVDFTPRFGAAIDFSYVRTPNVLDTKHQGYLLSFLGGPVYYPISYGNTLPFIHALAGVGLVDGAFPVSDTQFFHGWQSRFSYALGGGVERRLAGPIAVRLGGDYLRTAFYNSTGAVQPQNNFRVTASIVIHLKDRLHKIPGR